MSEFTPVETKADLETLCEDDVLAGYMDGLINQNEPGSDKSRGYWHGWRNAQTDKGRAPVDVSQQRLVREIIGASVNAH